MRKTEKTFGSAPTARRFIFIIMIILWFTQITSIGFIQAANDTKTKSAKYTITFIGNGENVTPVTVQITQEQQYLNALPPAPTRPGYIFAGWNTGKDGKGKAFLGKEKITGNITLYALWRVSIDNSTVPQGAVRAESWSLMNLILAIIGVLIVLMLLFLMIFRPPATESWDRVKNLTGIVVAIIAASSNVFIFMHSEPQLDAPADLANGYTVINTGIFIILLVGSHAALQRTRYVSEEENETRLEK